MTVFEANSWNEVEEWLAMLKQERVRLGGANGMHASELLFRGQADASWSLATTLERAYPKKLGLLRYYRSAFAAQHQIEAHTGLRWIPQSPEKYSEWLENHRTFKGPAPETFEYLAYLRHHGFPSPLLDWTASPYVAAYFAFGSALADTERVAVYAYLEFAGGAKGFSPAWPSIYTVGPYLRAHKRHFLQQSQYTYCIVRNDKEWSYAPHGEAFEVMHHEPQDLLWKLTFPVTERRQALEYLDKFNLNAFSLLGSEESLMETVAFRELGRE